MTRFTLINYFTELGFTNNYTFLFVADHVLNTKMKISILFRLLVLSYMCVCVESFFFNVRTRRIARTVENAVQTSVRSIENQANGIREDVNRHFNDIRYMLHNFLTGIVRQTNELAKTANTELVPRLTNLMENVTDTVRKANEFLGSWIIISNKMHTVVDIGIVLSCLLVSYAIKCYRLSTDNDFFARCVYIILSFFEMFAVLSAFYVFVNSLLKFTYGMEINDQLVWHVVTEFLITFSRSATGKDLERNLLPLYTVLFIIALVVIFGV